jgi:predicted nucleic acid-binding protein
VILLDTDVLSALMRDRPDEVVVAWLDRQVPDEVWTTVINVFEVRYGLSRLPDGRRRQALEVAFGALLHEDLGGRVAALDVPAASAVGRLAAQREAGGAQSTCVTR